MIVSFTSAVCRSPSSFNSRSTRPLQTTSKWSTGTKERSQEVNFTLFSPAGSFSSSPTALPPRAEPQQGTIGCKGASLLERVKPRCRASRNLWNACVNASQANRPTEGSVVSHGVRACAGRQPKSAIKQAVPDRRCHAVIAEAHDFDVIYFAQGRVDGQFESLIQRFSVSEGGVACRVLRYVERMSISHERLLLVRQIGYNCIGGEKARCCGVAVCRVVRQQQVVCQIQQPQMSPVTGVKLLAVE